MEQNKFQKFKMNKSYALMISFGFLCIFFLSACISTREYTNDLAMTFKLVGIAPMTFMIGSEPREPGRRANEYRHKVQLTRNYYIQTTEVTQRQWEQLMDDNPSFHSDGGGDCPVENITWYEAVEFCNILSEREGLPPAYSITGEEVIWDQTSNGYRLPTEAEWECASIGTLPDGITVNPNICTMDPALDRIAWYCINAGGETHPVALKDDTGFGGVMYDMLGNVWEWCWDEYGPYEVDDPNTAVIDPIGPFGTVSRDSEFKVLRGGSAYDIPGACRPAKRHIEYPSGRGLNGLRPARYENTGDE